jgi:intracellular septation protein
MWNFIHFILFIVAFKMNDIYAATMVIMATTLLETFISKFYKNNLKKATLWTTVMVWGFGALTLFFQDAYFIMLKPTIIYTVMGLFIIVSEFMNKSIVGKLLEASMEDKNEEEKISFDKKRLKVFSYVFGFSKLILAGVNYYYATYTNEDIWLTFKIYSGIGISVLMVGLLIYVVYPSIISKKDKKII